MNFNIIKGIYRPAKGTMAQLKQFLIHTQQKALTEDKYVPYYYHEFVIDERVG